jgi:hypothetical protein
MKSGTSLLELDVPTVTVSAAYAARTKAGAAKAAAVTRPVKVLRFKLGS